MTFFRTSDGIRNLGLFVDSDAIVYIEGAEGEIATGGSSAPDQRFWSMLWSKHKPLLKVAFKPLGSKNACIAMARHLESAQINNQFVCIDADFDHFVAPHTLQNKVIYSWGYSWENDIITREGLMSALSVATVANVADPRIAEEIGAACARLERVGRWIGPVDVRCQQQGHPLQIKTNPGALIDFHNEPPCFCRTRIKKRVRSIKGNVAIPFRKNSSFRFWRHYCGKSLLLFYYHLFIYISRRYGPAGKINRDIFSNILIREFEALLGAGRVTSAGYYERCFANV
jgi:hypothetical protein